ncbi:hypothetical protein L6452_38826 [Arctium lappa]|uniref:Uncharacterized protein n=1 Tax=Arctium lappa TaxID=4217 RepID=A0ACB8XR65_ARCLA|nr:hypothetical protein L6452_38826 [Arctium lappa]
MLKVSPWKGIIRFGKRGKLSPRFLGPFTILEKIGLQAYRLDLPPEMDGIHPTFHVCYLRKCLAEEESVILLTEIRVDNGNRCVEEPESILESKTKQLRRKEVTMVKCPGHNRWSLSLEWYRRFGGGRDCATAIVPLAQSPGTIAWVVPRVVEWRDSAPAIVPLAQSPGTIAGGV